MSLPTEPIGSIPRPLALLEAIARSGNSKDPSLDPLYEDAIRDTVRRFKATGSPVISDGEQRKYRNFWTCCVHTRPGGHFHSTHGADVDHAELLSSLFELNAGSFHIALAGEQDRVRVLKVIRDHRKHEQHAFVGVGSPIAAHIETPEEVCDRLVKATDYIPVDRLSTTEDCGFSPFSDDTSMSRDTAFAKIQARVQGTALAARIIEGR